MLVLVLNGGSSSLKYACFRDEKALLRDAVDLQGRGALDQDAAVAAVFTALQHAGLGVPDAVGHRMVHGGPDHVEPALVDATLRDELERAIPFAPLHLPAELRGIDAVSKHFAGVPQVVCFDTGFHAKMPEVAKRFAIPEKYFDQGLRRYGFHGLSYDYVVDMLGAKTLGRSVMAHLGSGASLAAIQDGVSVDTTMGFTPNAGLVMSTRSGDIDPGALLYLLSKEGNDAARVEHLLNHESGLLALSGHSGDMKELLARRAHDPRARLAVDMFCRSVRKGIGAMTAVLGGLDSLVFTGGMGASAPAVRREICEPLGVLGVHIDNRRNEENAREIHRDGETCRVYVLTTDEESMVAKGTRAVLGESRASNKKSANQPP